MDDTVTITCDLVTTWSFEVKIPRAEADADDFDPTLVLEKAYAEGAEWGDLWDHDFINAERVE